jgi:hypothetical protein
VREGFRLANTVFRARNHDALVAFACLAALYVFILRRALNANVEEDSPPAADQVVETNMQDNRQGTPRGPAAPVGTE